MATNNATNNDQLTTNGQLLIGSTGATPVVSTITAGSNITVTNGAGSISIAATAGAAGALTWIASATASNSATIDFSNNLSSTYDNYLVIVEGLSPITTSTIFQIRVGTGAGPTYQATNYQGGSYGFVFSAAGSFNANISKFVSGTTALDCNLNVSGGLITNAANTFSSAIININNVNDATNYKNINVDGNFSCVGSTSGIGQVRPVTAAQWQGATVLTSLRFLMSSGNISSGVFKLYGYQN